MVVGSGATGASVTAGAQAATIKASNTRAEANVVRFIFISLYEIRML
jgi:hypothetical protein